MGPFGPATSLRGNVLGTDHVAEGGRKGGGGVGEMSSGVEGESGEVSESIGELDEGEGEGWQGGG